MMFALLQVFLIFNAFGQPTDASNARTSYRFEVYPVDKCPMNISEFEEAAIRMNCPRDTRYLCAPDRNLSNLIEFCTDINRSLLGPDKCVRLEGTGYLNHYDCSEFSSGCPSTAYYDDAIYKYPACLSINRNLNCFVADTNCTKRPWNAKTIEMRWNNSKSDGSPFVIETNTSQTPSNMKQIIIFGICVPVYLLMLIGIMGFFLWRQKMYKGKTKQMDLQKLKDLVSKGEMTVRHVRCIILGCGGAGKTTLLRRLQNANFKDLKKIKVTELVDVHVNIFDVLENENTIQSTNADSKLPAITFPADLLKKNNTTTQIDETSFTNEQLTEESGQYVFKDDDLSERESLISNLKNVDEVVETVSNVCNETTKQDESIQFVPSCKQYEKEEKTNPTVAEKRANIKTQPYKRKQINCSKLTDAVKDLSMENHICPRVTFLDFAGQSMYYAFHQIYFSPKTCYILVVDMTKNLGDMVTKTDDKCCSLFKSWTYEDYYTYWLKSVDCYSDEDAEVILVGTHAENLSEDECKIFFKKFTASFGQNRNIQKHLREDRWFAIGFPKEESKLADLKEIKTCIADIVKDWRFSYEIQPVWGIFEHIMQEEKEQKIISRKTLLDYNNELSKDLRLNDDSITKMLLFFHRVGNLLYFDEGTLRETIILDVQWFVDAFKCIIRKDGNKATTYCETVRFQTTGEITDKNLTKIWEKSNEGQTFIAHKKDILLYMEKLGLLAICDTLKGQLTLYYVPSMNTRKFKNRENDITKSSILCFHFEEHGQLPFHNFYCLVVKCLKFDGWSVLQEKGENCWYENVACFTYENCIVVVCLCKFQIQLQVWILKENAYINPELLSDIQGYVEKTLSERQDSYEIGYKCKNGMLYDEEDTFYIKQTKFPVTELSCPNCGLDKKHLVDNKICWVLPELPRRRVNEENRTKQLSESKNNDEENNRETQEESALSPLRIACENGQDSMIQFLLDDGAEVNKLDEDGLGPLSISCQKGYNKCVQCLLDKGADINLRNNIGSSPLYIACQEGHQDTVKLLLEKGADINLCNDSGVSPLYIACQDGHRDTVRMLLLNGADINLCTKTGASPLFVACQYGHQSTVDILINNKATINLCTNCGTSPLYVACQYGHKSIAELLLCNNADINLCTNCGKSPLYIACQYGHQSIVKRLLYNNADINLSSKSDTSPLIIACTKGYYTILKLLLNHGEGINLCTDIGANLLCIACQYGHFSIVKLLLNNGADVKLCTTDGSSPMTNAIEKKHDNIVQILKKKQVQMI